MSDETEKRSNSSPCYEPGIDTNICIDEKLAHTVKLTGEGAALLEQAARGPKTVNAFLERTATTPTVDQALWSAIRNRTDAIAFDRYFEFINRLFCTREDEGTDEGTPACEGAPCEDSALSSKQTNNGSTNGFGAPSIRDRRDALARQPSIYGIDAYQLLKVATQAFLLFEAGIVIKDRNPLTGAFDPVHNCNDVIPDETSKAGRAITFKQLEEYLKTSVAGIEVRGLPYLGRIVNALAGLGGVVKVDDGKVFETLPYCETIMKHRFNCPSLLELIWSYWHEEGMLVQTINAIALRFQNRRRGTRDPLANLELDPLFPLNNILWGFIQDEYSRLSVQRRAYEYDHHYGLTLYGKAIPQLKSADSRSKFISAFHNLLYRTAMFYREDDDMTVRADAFALLNALREVHIILAEGAHNQFGDLPWTARAEMLIMQWMLARPEIRAFLRGRHMVPYREAWMGAVDDMKRLQGWTDTTVTHFHELARFGEQIVLSVRYGDWIEVNDQEQARNWARAWRPEIQRYIHAYQTATGVDLSAEVMDAGRADARYLQPSLHLRNRLAAQQPRRALTGSTTRTRALPGMSGGYIEEKVGPRAKPRRRLLAPASRDEYE
jgi:hypothetical protein